MKLIASLTSPFVRKVRVVLAEKRIDADLVIDSPWTDDTQVQQFNPLGKIPVLVLDDDSRLFDSRVIVEYLDHAAPNNRLLPVTPRERIVVRRWEALGDGICEAAANAFLEARRPDGERSAAWIARQRDKVTAALRSAAEDLNASPWCFGNAFTLADIAMGCALGYLDFRFPDIDWRAAHPNLAGLHTKLMRRPSFADTVPQG
ncbi:MAG: glutathione S-transferase [Betaproteobacteria bacterium]|nr:glutathione S-transferase [Betaproteobacteria bacterium]